VRRILTLGSKRLFDTVGKKVFMIRKCEQSEFEMIHEIINDAAQTYKGVIPADCWHEPYMSREQLKRDIEQGVIFWGFEKDGNLAAVMGIQDKGDVNLIRHAYVRLRLQNQGVGTRLLQHLESTGDKPILIGTWADAVWAIAFYQKNGYRRVTEAEKDRLLVKYWTIPTRQVQCSVVLANTKWGETHKYFNAG
jgi:N-acetylglutamate synthase-like GNAT family acetyltransferase